MKLEASTRWIPGEPVKKHFTARRMQYLADARRIASTDR
jgi:hypothetical protein